MKERRIIKDRRNKEPKVPKEGMPFYYRRYNPDRRKNKTSQESSVKSIHLPKS